MSNRSRAKASTKTSSWPYRVRLPGFVRDDDVGLGDVIKQATAGVGVHPCGGCAKRAEVLNRWFMIAGRRSE